MSVGERISDLRKQQNISQNELAKSLGVSRQAVSKWENDLSRPDTQNLILIAEVLQTEVEFLATGRKPVYQEPPIVVNLVKKEDKIVERAVEKPTIKRIVRIRYLRNPVEFAALGIVCFLIGLLIGLHV